MSRSFQMSDCWYQISCSNWALTLFLLGWLMFKNIQACRGSHSSRSVVRRVPKQVASAFVKRTLARCRNFEDTGKSCFSEIALHDVALTAPSCNNDGITVDYAGSGTASNKCNEVCSNKSEARGSGISF